jgi:hypothetical protein
LVRVFVRPGAKMPRGLEKRLSDVPQCVAVASPKTGANSADFVMSMHTGILHATLPMHIPFTIVTNDKSLSVMCQELQRVGRRADLWTSHPEQRGGRAARAPKAAVKAPSRRGGRGRRPASRPAAPSPAVPVAAPASPAPSGKVLAEVASSYAARLSRIKDPPSRLKTLLNDIKNRAAASGFSPEAILEELKSSGVLTVDQNGRVVLTAR